MTLPKLHIRELFWLVLVCALMLGWWVDRRYLSRGLAVLVDHIYKTEGRYAHWNDQSEMIATDR